MTPANTSQQKPRRWLIPASIAIITFIGSLAGEYFPTVFGDIPEAYRWVLWAILGIALITSVIVAIIETRQSHDAPAPSSGNNLNVQGNFSVGGNFVGQNKNIGGDVVGGNKITNVTTNIYEAISYRPGSAPPLSPLIIGRENELSDLKTKLKVASASVQILTAVRGWPGVGKTTIASALAHDRDLAADFPDGVLWVSLGQTPNLLSELAAWGRALGTDDLLKAKNVEEASAQLAALLRNKRMLLIVDDVWEPEHAMPFKVGGRGCAMLITTRVNSVAQALAPTANDLYKLKELSDDKALELLQKLAPTVVAQYPQPSRELVRELEGLPLALQVAGHLLNVEASYGFSVINLLNELREGAKLLAAKAPADRADLANETTPTVAALLQKSTDRLDSHTRDCFAYLGAFAPKPATFDLAAMKAVWQVDDPKPIVSRLVDRGLLESIFEIKRYQMHALLVMHAKSFLTE